MEKLAANLTTAGDPGHQYATVQVESIRRSPSFSATGVILTWPQGLHLPRLPRGERATICQLEVDDPRRWGEYERDHSLEASADHFMFQFGEFTRSEGHWQYQFAQMLIIP